MAHSEAARQEAAETEPKLFKQIDHLLTLRRNLDFKLFYIAACMAEDFLQKKAGDALVAVLRFHIEVLNSSAVPTLR